MTTGLSSFHAQKKNKRKPLRLWSGLWVFILLYDIFPSSLSSFFQLLSCFSSRLLVWSTGSHGPGPSRSSVMDSRLWTYSCCLWWHHRTPSAMGNWSVITSRKIYGHTHTHTEKAHKHRTIPNQHAATTLKQFPNFFCLLQKPSITDCWHHPMKAHCSSKRSLK